MAKTLPRVAYFCMEYGLDNSMKTYAGGLGILAGDYLKGAKDHNFPIIGVGIKWKQGYTDQRISPEGKAYDSYHNYEYDFMEDTGVVVEVVIRKRTIKCKVWKLEAFGNATLYLLDTDVPGNEDGWITGQLYGWFGEERIAQEMVLGIGGVRALRALGEEVDLYHFNEGHALFAGFELVREHLESKFELTLEEAIAEARQQIIFTTHTPVVQGNESHYIDRLLYMGADNGCFSPEQLRRLGGSPFNMTVGALRMAKKSNAVAQLHGQTANKMWEKVKDISQIIAITNGIHIPTWVDEEMIQLAENGGDLWARHLKNKQALIDFVAERNGVKLDLNILTIGFSRRSVPYKRSNFIFTDRKIIEPLLKGGKLQIIFSGKAHPLDDKGKEIVASIVEYSKEYPKSVVFLENYDMQIGRMLVTGSDVWLNNPRRPKEASGTSGMKAAMNGVINFSTLDGWWPEACDHGVNGWQFGDGFEDPDEEVHDAHDLPLLYKVLTEEIIPTFYQKPEKWQEMMKASILSTKDQFSVKRMLEEYYELLYKA
ncbi:MAG: alpha-glucan family phosphorylase [Microscillaceae bacterium]|nr:alpha-glucan family phosphorylase [Microscillaceae bacterium]